MQQCQLRYQGIHMARAAPCNGTWSRLSNVTGRQVEETDFKIDYLFCPTDIGGPLMPVQLDLEVIEKIVVLWMWSTGSRTQTKVLVLVLVAYSGFVYSPQPCSWVGVMLKLMCKILASWFLMVLKFVGPKIISIWKILQSLTHSVHHFYQHLMPQCVKYQNVVPKAFLNANLIKFHWNIDGLAQGCSNSSLVPNHRYVTYSLIDNMLTSISPDNGLAPNRPQAIGRNKVLLPPKKYPCLPNKL